MTRVVLHQLRDWPVAEHLLPLLRMLGVAENALDASLYFHAGPDFELDVQSKAHHPEAERALRAAGLALAHFGRSLVGIARVPAGEANPADATLKSGLAWVGRDAVARALQDAGHEVIFASAAHEEPSLADDLARLTHFAYPMNFEEIVSGTTFGSPVFESKSFVLLGLYARFEELDRSPGSQAERLLKAPLSQPYRALVDVALDHLLARGVFQHMHPVIPEIACSDAARPGFAARLKQSLFSAPLPPSTHALLAIRYHYNTTFSPEEEQAWAAQWRQVVRAEGTLVDLTAGESRMYFAPEEYRELQVRGFRQALASDALAFTDLHYLEHVADVHEVDPDLCLRVLLRFLPTMDPRELGQPWVLPQWEQAIPSSGYSTEARNEAAAFFAHPSRRALLVKMLAFLRRRDIPVSAPAPLTPHDLDTVEIISTDVGTLAIGSEQALARLEEAEDPTEWVSIVKKHKCVAFTTIGDGEFSLRVASRAKVTMDASAKSIGVFPLQVQGETLGLTGIVGPDLRFVSFPDGTYAAELFQHTDSMHFTLLIEPAKPAPKWTFGKELPRAGDFADQARS